MKAPLGGGDGIFKEMHNWRQNNSLLLFHVCPDQRWKLLPCRPHLQKSFSAFQEHSVHSGCPPSNIWYEHIFLNFCFS